MLSDNVEICIIQNVTEKVRLLREESLLLKYDTLQTVAFHSHELSFDTKYDHFLHILRRNYHMARLQDKVALLLELLQVWGKQRH